MTPSVVAHRRALHRIPELDRDLPETLAYVKNILEPLGCEVFSPVTGSLCAWFDRGREHTVAFRADLDALPVEEAGEAPYRSCHPGKMHACGHDGHTAMVLALGELAAKCADLPRNVLLIFQPAEETQGGAKGICETGLLERCHVDRIFGFHLWPGLPEGTVWTRPGAMMAKNSEINVIIEGKSAHITRSEQGVDALWIGCEALRRIRELEAAELPAGEPGLVKFGKMVSGTVRNAVSSHTELQGTVRVFSMDTFRRIVRRCREIMADLEGEYGCKARVEFSEGYLPVMNDPELVETVCRALGEEAPGLLEHPDMTAEDFSFYQDRVPGMFCFLGVGDAPALHAADFDFDDEAVLPRGVVFFRKLLLLP